MNKVPKTCKKIDFNKQYPEGIECTFVSCKNGWGLKLYTSKKDRNFGFKRQKKLNKHGLAPRVGRNFDFKLTKKQYLQTGDSILYGYITEEAKIVAFPKKKDYKKLFKLRKQIKKIGYKFVDYGFHNAAYLHNKLVVIDCNPLTFQK